MHTKTRWLIGLIALLAVLLMLPATPALAADDDPPGVTIVGKDYTVEDGEEIDGDLVVINGDVTIEDGGRVRGSVIIWNGSADVEGTIDKDLVVSSGDIYLGENARVKGNVICSWNCDMRQDLGARIDGGIVEGTPSTGFRWENTPLGHIIESPMTVWRSGVQSVMDGAVRVARGIISVLVMATIAGLVTLVLPEPVAKIEQTVTTAPWQSMGVGLLAALAAAAAITVLAITICFIPAAIVLAIALGAAGLFGWIGVGMALGERLLPALNVRGQSPLWTAAAGTLVISTVAILLDLVPCVNVISSFVVTLIGCAGLGAAVLTRAGTVAYAPTPTPTAEVEVVEEESPADA